MGKKGNKKFRYMLEPSIYRKIFENHFRIPEYGTTTLVPLKLNMMQNEVLDKMDYFNIILKARKEGISTEVLGLATVNCNEIPNYHAVFLADNDPNTQSIFSRVKDFDTHMHNLKLNIDITKENIKFLRTNARMDIATAGRKTAFRGSDIHFVHCSEIAFFTYPDVYEAVLEACTRGAIVFLESTANGRNLFYQLWNKSKQYPKGSSFKPFFFGWNKHPRYKIEVSSDFKLNSDEQKYISQIKDLYGIELSNEQIAWRRWKLDSMPNPDKFPQEYPLIPQEAFLATGNPVFNQNKLDLMLKQSADYRQGSIDLNRKSELSWVDESSGLWEMYHSPEEGKDYIIGADIAEGLEDGDFNAAFVLDPLTWVQVAQFHGKLDPDQFAYELNKCGRYYNQALLAVERNNHGYTVNSRLYSDYEYPRLYQEERESDEMISETTMNYGFRTNLKTRPLMVDTMKRYIRKGVIKINSVTCINECMSFVTNKVGKPMHEVGSHDDTVFAAMIAVYVADQLDPDTRARYNLSAKKSYYDLIQKQSETRKTGRAGY